nr:MAG TPA: hypothetical protein [Caudoviricetes sp.]
MKKRKTLSSIGIISVFATCGAENIFTAFVLMIISLTCLYFGKAFNEKTWK